MARGLMGLLAALVVSIGAPAAASAAQLFAAPGGDNLSACTPGNPPCEIHRAFSLAAANDEVIVTAGDYGSEGAPLPGQVVSAAPGLNVHGETGSPRPRLFLDTGDDTSGLKLSGAGTTVRHLEVQVRPTLGSRQATLELDNAQADDIVALSTASQGRACALLHSSTITNSVCEAIGPSDTRGIATFVGVTPTAPSDSVVRNVTAIASSVTGTAILAFANTLAQGDQKLTVSNTIARGHTDIAADQTMAVGGGVATVTVDHSNFGFESSQPGGSGDRVVDGPGGGNQRSLGSAFPVSFLGANDFHQASISTTIDAGVTAPANGATDFDGDPRALGASTDIGADEFVPAPTATTGDPGALTLSTAAVNASVNPNALASTYHFDFGRNSDYGTSTAEIDAGSGNAAVPVTEVLTGLDPDTIYHYRVVATSRGGTSAGEDRTVKTLAAGGGGGGNGGGNGGGKADLLSLALMPRAFAAAGRGPSVKQAARKGRDTQVGTTVSFELSGDAAVSFSAERKQRRGHKPRRFVPLKGSFEVEGKGGANSFKFTGRLRGRKLAPGRYRLVADAGGDVLRAPFKIVTP